jgi:hypothetical protein
VIQEYVLVLKNDHNLHTLGDIKTKLITEDDWQYIKIPFFVKRMLRFATASALPGPPLPDQPELNPSIDHESDSDMTEQEKKDFYNDPRWVKSHSFLRIIRYGDYSGEPLHNLPYDTRFNLKDTRDIAFLNRILPIERNYIWKKIDWRGDVDGAIQESRTAKKPLLMFHRACLFGEKGGMV